MTSKHSHYILRNEREGCNHQFTSTLEINKHLQGCLANCQQKYGRTPCFICKVFEDGKIKPIPALPDKIVDIEIACTLTSNYEFCFI